MPRTRIGGLPGARLIGLTAIFFGALVAQPAAVGAADGDRWLSRDKAMHFDATAGIAALAYAGSVAWVVDARWKGLAVGAGAALGAGVGKELLDASGIVRGDPSWRDLAWDVIGTAAGLALAWSADLLLGGVTAEHALLGSSALGSGASGVAVRF